MYYMNFHKLDDAHKTPQIQFIETIGKMTIAMAVIILSCYEVIRNVSCKYLYNKVPGYRSVFIEDTTHTGSSCWASSCVRFRPFPGGFTSPATCYCSSPQLHS